MIGNHRDIRADRCIAFEGLPAANYFVKGKPPTIAFIAGVCPQIRSSAYKLPPTNWLVGKAVRGIHDKEARRRSLPNFTAWHTRRRSAPPADDNVQKRRLRDCDEREHERLQGKLVRSGCSNRPQKMRSCALAAGVQKAVHFTRSAGLRRRKTHAAQLYDGGGERTRHFSFQRLTLTSACGMISDTRSRLSARDSDTPQTHFQFPDCGITDSSTIEFEDAQLREPAQTRQRGARVRQCHIILLPGQVLR
jgi:hypothetical protein